jgi:hypothetical protein
LVLQNNGTLSARKRKRFLGWIAEAEFQTLERAILTVLENINENSEKDELEKN